MALVSSWRRAAALARRAVAKPARDRDDAIQPPVLGIMCREKAREKEKVLIKREGRKQGERGYLYRDDIRHLDIYRHFTATRPHPPLEAFLSVYLPLPPLMLLLDALGVAALTAAFAAQPAEALNADGVDAVCVLQREAAVVLPGSPRRVVGSGEATTCVIALVCARGTSDEAAGAAPALGVLVAHLDDAATASRFAAHAGVLAADSSAASLEMSLVGAYNDTADGAATVAAVLAAMDALPGVTVRLLVLCVRGANTVAVPGAATPQPRFVGAAIDVATGNVRPAAWTSGGPLGGTPRAPMVLVPCQQ